MVRIARIFAASHSRIPDQQNVGRSGSSALQAAARPDTDAAPARSDFGTILYGLAALKP